jgi:hypothetical protein
MEGRVQTAMETEAKAMSNISLENGFVKITEYVKLHTIQAQFMSTSNTLPRHINKLSSFITLQLINGGCGPGSSLGKVEKPCFTQGSSRLICPAVFWLYTNI